VSGIASVVGLALPLRRSQRATAVGAGLLLASSALIFVVGAVFLPLFHLD
jgi:hypothetical protein